MTPSPEERAKQLAEKLSDEAVSGHPEEGYDFIEALAEPIIAAALRAAENEALEKAAKVAETMKYGPTYFAEGRLNSGPIIGGEDIATAIRALKTGE